MSFLKLNSFSGEAEIAGELRQVTVDNEGLHIHGVDIETASDLLHALSLGSIRGYQPAGKRSAALAVLFTGEEQGVDKPAPSKPCDCADKCVEKKAEPPKTKSFADDIAEVKASLHRAVQGTSEETAAPEEKQVEKPAPEEKQVEKPTRRRRRSTKAATVADDIAKDPEDIVTTTGGVVASSDDDAIVDEPDDDVIVDEPDDEPVQTAEETPEEDAAVPVVESSENDSEADSEETSEQPKTAMGADDQVILGELYAADSMRTVITIFQKYGINTLAKIRGSAKKYQASVPVLARASDALDTRITRTAKGCGITA